MPLCPSSSGGWGLGLVEGAVAEHGVDEVAAASGQGDQRLVVFFALGAFAVLVGPRERVFQGGEGREEQGAFEDFVASA